MKPINTPKQTQLGVLVFKFLTEMHRFDRGRTLPLMQPARLTTAQLAVLEWVRTPRTLSAIAQYLGLSRPATSQMVDKLARHQLVRRTEGVVDRRERSIELSATGLSLLAEIAHSRAARFNQALHVLPRPLAAELEKALAPVVALLERGAAT